MRTSTIIVLATTLLVACKETPSSNEKAVGAAPAASAPASQPASRPGSQPASRPGSQPAMTAAQARIDSGKARLSKTEAGKVVLASIEAHGGLEAWFRAGTLAFTYDYQPVEGPRRRSYQIVDLLGARAYHEMTHPKKGRLAWDGEKAWMKFEDGGRYPARFWALTPYYFVGLPFVLSDPGVRLELVSDDPKKAGFPPKTRVVRATFEPGTGDAPDDYYVLYIDARSSVLLGVRYVVSYQPFMKGDMSHTPEKLLVFTSIEPAGDLLLSREHVTYAFAEGKKGKRVTRAPVEDLDLGVPFDVSRLAMPEGGVVDDSLDKSEK